MDEDKKKLFAAYMSVTLLFRSALQGCNLEQRARLHKVPDMLRDPSIPLTHVAAYIWDTRGKDWDPGEEWTHPLESLRRGETP